MDTNFTNDKRGWRCHLAQVDLDRIDHFVLLQNLVAYDCREPLEGPRLSVDTQSHSDIHNLPIVDCIGNFVGSRSFLFRFEDEVKNIAMSDLLLGIGNTVVTVKL